MEHSRRMEGRYRLIPVQAAVPACPVEVVAPETGSPPFWTPTFASGTPLTRRC